MLKVVAPLLIGTVIILGGVALAAWNEYRMAGAADLRSVVRAKLVELDAGRADPAQDGRIGRVAGVATATGEVVDPATGLDLPVLRLDRIVETAQWRETGERRAKNDTPWRYELIWSARQLDSSNYIDRWTYRNPPLRLQTTSLLAPGLRLGAWQVADPIWQAIPGDSSLLLPQRLEVRDIGILTRSGDWWWSGDPRSPQAGDVRLRYEAVPLGEVTLIGQVAGGRLVPVQDQRGFGLPLGGSGDLPADVLIGSAANAAALDGWKGRAFAFVLILFGSLILTFPARKLAPQLMASLGGSGMALGALFALILWLGVTVTTWLLFRRI